MNSNIVTVGKKIRQIREAVGLSRPNHPDLHKFTLWLLADKKVAEIGQIGPDDLAKA